MQIKSEKEWNVTGKLFGKAKRRAPGEYQKSKDMSGIACDRADGFPRNGLVIDDEAQAAQLVVVNDGELVAGDRIQLITDTFNGEPLELDGEAVAYEEGFYYVIGSHGHPRDRLQNLDAVADKPEIEARIAASSRLFRIGATAPYMVTGTEALKSVLKTFPAIAPFIDTPLSENGLTIEGLAVKDRRAFVGLRSPVIEGKAAIVSVALDDLFGGLPRADAKLFLLDLGGRGIRDMAVDGNSFTLLAGPSAYEKISFVLYRWAGDAEVSSMVELPPYAGTDGKEWKPEGILPLDELRMLVLLDTAPLGSPREIVLQ